MKRKTVIERHTLCREQAVLFKHLPHPAILNLFSFFLTQLALTIRTIRTKWKKAHTMYRYTIICYKNNSN